MSKLNRLQRHALWGERLERFEAADCSVAEFCRGERVSVSNFYVWKKRLALTSGAQPRSLKSNTTNPKFLPLVVNAATLHPMLKLPGGALIELPSQLGRQQLTDLIAAVVEATDAARTSAEVAS